MFGKVFHESDFILVFRPAICVSDRRLICQDGKEICEEQRCDGQVDCSYGEDEDNCGYPSVTAIPESMIV